MAPVGSCSPPADRRRWVGRGSPRVVDCSRRRWSAAGVLASGAIGACLGTVGMGARAACRVPRSGRSGRRCWWARARRRSCCGHGPAPARRAIETFLVRAGTRVGADRIGVHAGLSRRARWRTGRPSRMARSVRDRGIPAAGAARGGRRLARRDGTGPRAGAGRLGGVGGRGRDVAGAHAIRATS